MLERRWRGEEALLKGNCGALERQSAASSLNPNSLWDSGEHAGPTQMTWAFVHLLIQQMYIEHDSVPGCQELG